jgi:aspartate-semialdehyde dehydrogenase
MNKQIPVAVLGANGSVGQRFISLLGDHPLFKVVALTASDRSIGKKYKDACRWILSEKMPAWAEEIVLTPSDVNSINGARICFSALPASEAYDIEPALAKAGIVVCSNASSYRREIDVPLLLPEVNGEHIGLITQQQRNHGWQGAILTNPNCTSTGLTVALKALDDSFGVKKVMAVSLQALSGAGYPGIPSLDVIDNVIPNINGEEEKVEWEPLKMLGKITDNGIKMADIQISAHTNRVAVIDGHTVCVNVELAENPTIEAVNLSFLNYRGPKIAQNLPSTPDPVIDVRYESDRPQPKLDRFTGKGMSTVVGRVRKDTILTLKFVVLSHNTIRGAAGGSIYNAELFVSQGFLK